ncbi:MAG: FliH/SctL family protein [Gemmatimonadaceae bacterium]
MLSSDMSASDRSSSESGRPNAQITAWALDELEMGDIFVPFSQESSVPSKSDIDEDAEETLASPQERARIEAAAYAHGRADGEKIARAEFGPRLDSAAAALNDAVKLVSLHQARWVANAEENLSVLSVAIARSIIAREVETDATVVAGLVQRALSQFPLDQQITVRLHPDDVDVCEMQLSKNASRTPDIRWLSDSLVQRGGCMVEGRERIIDGRVDTALERVYRQIGNVQS